MAEIGQHRHHDEVIEPCFEVEAPYWFIRPCWEILAARQQLNPVPEGCRASAISPAEQRLLGMGDAGHQHSAQKWFLSPTADFPLRAIFRRIRQQLIDCRQEAKSNSNCGNLPRKSKQFGSSGARGSPHAPFQESLFAIGECAAQHTHTQILKIPLSLVVGCFLSELRLLPKVTQGVGHLGCGCSASHTERAYRQTLPSSAPSSYGAKALPGNGIIFGRLESLQRTEG